MLPNGMAEAAPFTSFGASRSQINKAGDVLRAYWQDPDADIDPTVEHALELAWRYRAEFQVPLTKVVMGLRSFVRSEGALAVVSGAKIPRPVVAQRLKRMPAILDKLGRFSQMDLSRMQDIAGCRAIVPSQDAVHRLVRRIRRRSWQIVEEYDYVSRPKNTGYRAVHLIVLRDHRLIEIQLRTVQQHDWAEAVESATFATGFHLKDGQGPTEVVTLFERAAYALERTTLGETMGAEFDAEYRRLQEAAAPYFRRE